MITDIFIAFITTFNNKINKIIIKIQCTTRHHPCSDVIKKTVIKSNQPKQSSKHEFSFECFVDSIKKDYDILVYATDVPNAIYIRVANELLTYMLIDGST